jgi:hypothetical protein
MTQGRRDAALRLLDPLVARWREGQETRDLRVSASLLESLRAN